MVDGLMVQYFTAVKKKKTGAGHVTADLFDINDTVQSVDLIA